MMRVHGALNCGQVQEGSAMRRFLVCGLCVAAGLMVGVWGLVLGVGHGAGGGSAAEEATEAVPENRGPLELLTASWLGGPGEEELLAVGIASDGSLWVAGNTAHLGAWAERLTVLGPPGQFDAQAAPPPPDPKTKRTPEWRHPSTHGFLVRLSAEGRKVLGGARFGYGQATVRRLRLDAQGRLWLLAQATAALDLGSGEPLRGTFLLALSPDGQRIVQTLPHPEMIDFALDGNGEVLVLAQKKLTRYAADGRTVRWTATWKAHGDNRPHAVTVVPSSGIAVVTGYGMTHTSKEPYKDPYAVAFDRAGKELWMLWNPDPRLQRATKWATAELPANGLMADTTGRYLFTAPDGRVYIILYADGGNTICTRDPRDVFRPLDPQVHAGVYQGTPGFGFRGASRTSVVFRLNPADGRLEKGTWMCAWRDKSHANFLSLEGVAADGPEPIILVGNSAANCPTQHPWYVCREGGYPGGGFLAAFDRDFRLLQCGYFPGAHLSSVAIRQGIVAAVGRAKQFEDDSSRQFTRIYQAPQKSFGGGTRDGYIVVFRLRGQAAERK
jgi:hypothetical protein